MDHRPHPVFRLRELGLEFRPHDGRALADQMHRHYEAVADEPMPQELAELAQELLWRRA